MIRTRFGRTGWIVIAMFFAGSAPAVSLACTELGLEQALADFPEVPATYFAGDETERQAQAPDLYEFLAWHPGEFEASVARGLADLAGERGQAGCAMTAAEIHESSGKTLYSVAGHVKIRSYPITVTIACTPLPGGQAKRITRKTTLVVKHQMLSTNRAESCFGQYGSSGVYLRF